MKSTPAVALEQFLARLYVDPEALTRFLAAPELEARRGGLDEEGVRSLAAIDRDDLTLASRSFARKRAMKPTGDDAG